jgi:hypothetical protein
MGDLDALDAAIASYLTSKYFTELAPGTRAMRRRLLKNIRAEVQRLSAADGDVSTVDTRTPEPVDPHPRTHSRPWRPVRRRGSWATA